MKTCGCHGSKRGSCYHPNHSSANLAHDVQKLEEKNGLYFLRETNIDVKFGWFSQKSANKDNTCLYRTVYGNAVHITEVTSQILPSCWRWGDLVYVGLVTNYISGRISERPTPPFLKEKISWKNTFNSDNHWYGHIANARAVAKLYGYEYYIWNGWVYRISDSSIMGSIQSILKG